MLKCSSQIEHNNFNTLIWQKSIYKAWHYNKTRYTGSKHIWICTILATRTWKGIFVSGATTADELAAWLMNIPEARITSTCCSSHLLWRGFGPWGTILLETAYLLAAAAAPTSRGGMAGAILCSWRLKSLLTSSSLHVLKPRMEFGKCDISKSRRMQGSRCRKNILTAYEREREREREARMGVY